MCGLRWRSKCCSLSSKLTIYSRNGHKRLPYFKSKYWSSSVVFPSVSFHHPQPSTTPNLMGQDLSKFSLVHGLVQDNEKWNSNTSASSPTHSYQDWACITLMRHYSHTNTHNLRYLGEIDLYLTLEIPDSLSEEAFPNECVIIKKKKSISYVASHINSFGRDTWSTTFEPQMYTWEKTICQIAWPQVAWIFKYKNQSILSEVQKQAGIECYCWQDSGQHVVCTLENKKHKENHMANTSSSLQYFTADSQVPIITFLPEILYGHLLERLSSPDS